MQVAILKLGKTATIQAARTFLAVNGFPAFTIFSVEVCYNSFRHFGMAKELLPSQNGALFLGNAVEVLPMWISNQEVQVTRASQGLLGQRARAARRAPRVGSSFAALCLAVPLNVVLIAIEIAGLRLLLWVRLAT